MEIEEITKTLREYIVERYAVPADDADFTEDVHLFDYGYVDSFGAVDLVSYVQKAFGVKVSQADMLGIGWVQRGSAIQEAHVLVG